MLHKSGFDFAPCACPQNHQAHTKSIRRIVSRSYLGNGVVVNRVNQKRRNVIDLTAQHFMEQLKTLCG
jgi:hypothetical protein